MSFDTIRQEITTWDETALRRLIAYAVVLQDRKSGQLGAELARKLVDPSGRGAWIGPKSMKSSPASPPIRRCRGMSCRA